MTEKLTMAAVWEELEENEKKIIREMTGIEMGPLALSKISTILKAIVYRYHDKPSEDYRQSQMEAQIKQYQAQLQAEQKRLEYEFAMRNQRQAVVSSGISSGTPWPKW